MNAEVTTQQLDTERSTRVRRDSSSGEEENPRAIEIVAKFPLKRQRALSGRMPEERGPSPKKTAGTSPTRHGRSPIHDRIGTY